MIVPVGNWYHRKETHLWRWQLHLLDLFFNQKETLNAVTMLLCLGQANYHEFSLAQLTFSDTRNMLSIVLGAKQRCANGCVLLSERNYTKLYILYNFGVHAECWPAFVIQDGPVMRKSWLTVQWPLGWLLPSLLCTAWWTVAPALFCTSTYGLISLPQGVSEPTKKQGRK